MKETLWHQSFAIFADLKRANLKGAKLYDADMSFASLHEAKVTLEQLAKAASLKDATMPDGSTHS